MTDFSSPLWRLEVLGEMRLQRLDMPDAVPITRFRSRKTAGLLAFLALRRGAHRREILSDLFWPETETNLARGSLRVALTSLRQLLETEDSTEVGAILQIWGDKVALSAALVTDVELFRRALFEADSETEKSSETAARRAALERALGWYRGPLSGDETDEFSGEAGRLEDEFVRATREFCALCEARSQTQREPQIAREVALSEALEAARRGLEKAPWREEIALEVLRLSLAQQKPEAARDFKRWCARAKKQGILVSDEALLKAREWETAARGARVPVSPPLSPLFLPTARGVAGVPNGARVLGFPSVWTQFFGRKREIEQLQNTLQDGARLVTLTGAGGVGKTAIASQIALRSEGFGLVVWLSLADLPVASRIPATLLETLGAPQKENFAPLDALRSATPEGARALLILDGFEHLCDDGAPLVREWLDAMPELVCLLTSRRALGFAGEACHEILPLEISAISSKNLSLAAAKSNEKLKKADLKNGAMPEVEAARGEIPEREVMPENSSANGSESGGEAARALFLDRARMARAAWSPSPDEVAVIDAICARLQGLPLALEIAAARLGLRSPAQIAAEIAASSAPNNFEADDLSGVLSWKNLDRAAPLRHASLRASIAWSERQLPLAAARFWAQISVFRSGFTLDAAAQICEVDAAPLVMTLVESSLLRLDMSGAATRAVQLEIERQYAANTLGETARTALEERHARYFQNWLETSPDESALAAERFNLARAREWFARHEDESA